jgi:BASS family bile acid:Na+ symporter
MAVVAAGWGVWHIIAGLSVSWFFSRRSLGPEAALESVSHVG